MSTDIVDGVEFFTKTDAQASRGVTLVVHPVPAYRHGVAVGLIGSGFSVREASTFADSADRWDMCLLAMGSAHAWEVLAAIGENAGPVVALLPAAKPADYQLALRCGAACAVAQDAPVQRIVNVLDAALHGTALLPVEVARSLADGSVPIPDTIEISDQVADWLRALAKGTPISTIARNAGYSERQMYRRMQQVYRRMGARNRGEAICIAARWGIGSGRPGRGTGTML